MSASYIVDDGVVISSDFDSLLMLTAYTHFEEAMLHFRSIGVSLPADPPPIDYKPTVNGGVAFGFPSTDNAAFFSLTDSFVLLPMSVFQDIPFAMNTGVIAHESSHRVFYYQALGGQMFSAIYAHQSDPSAQNNFNRAKSTDEGLADFFAASMTGDPLFIAKSMTPYSPSLYASIWQDRDLTRAWTLDSAWLNGDQPVVQGTYNPYPPGTVLASSLWSIAQSAGFQATEQAVAIAELALSPQLLGALTYDYGDIECEILRQLPAAARANACTVFKTRYAVIASRFAGVCP